MSAPTPAPLDRREAAMLETSIEILSRGQELRDIVRLFASRRAQRLPLEPLQTAFINEIWRVVARDAGLL